MKVVWIIYLCGGLLWFGLLWFTGIRLAFKDNCSVILRKFESRKLVTKEEITNEIINEPVMNWESINKISSKPITKEELIKEITNEIINEPVTNGESVNEIIFYIMGGISLFIFLLERLVTYSTKTMPSGSMSLYAYSFFLPLIHIIFLLFLLFIMIKIALKLVYLLVSNDYKDRVSLGIITIVMFFLFILVIG